MHAVHIVCVLPPLTAAADSVDWTLNVEDVRIAGTPHAYNLADDGHQENVKLLLRAWVLERFGAEAMPNVTLHWFLRCETRGIFMRCATYGNDDKRVDYCVQVAASVEEAGAAVVAEAAAAAGAADAAGVANPAADWHGAVEMFFCARLAPQPAHNVADVTEMIALVQPYAIVPHSYCSEAVASLPPGWEEMAQWITDRALLPHAVSVSREQSRLLPRRIVRLRDIVAKRCLLDSPSGDNMMIVRLQNRVEEL